MSFQVSISMYDRRPCRVTLQYQKRVVLIPRSLYLEAIIVELFNGDQGSVTPTPLPIRRLDETSVHTAEATFSNLQQLVEAIGCRAKLSKGENTQVVSFLLVQVLYTPAR